MKALIASALVALFFSTGCGSSPCHEPKTAEIAAARASNDKSRAAALAAKGLRDVAVPYEPSKANHMPLEVWVDDQTSFIASLPYLETDPSASLSFAVDEGGGTWLLDERPRVRRVLHNRSCSCSGGGTPPMMQQLVYRLPPGFRGKVTIEYDIDRIEEDRFNLQSDGSSCPAYP